MQYVYLLTNEHVPGLVKFGFTTRDPASRAAELSGPTAVPGRWIVFRYWEVSDGAAAEKRVFEKLAKHRLGRQEFFRLQADEAAALIGRLVAVVGVDPVERDAAVAARAIAIEEKRQRNEANERRVRYERAIETSKEIDLATSHLHARIRDVHKYAQFGISIAVGAIVFILNSDEDAVVIALRVILAPLLMFPITTALAVFFFTDQQAEKRIAEISRGIIEGRGYSDDQEYKKHLQLMDRR